MQERGGRLGSSSQGPTASQSALDERFVVFAPNRVAFRVAAKHLERDDLNASTLNEWRRGKVVRSSDLLRYTSRQVTLALWAGGGILGVVNVREPTDRSIAGYPEVVAVETNPRLRGRVKGIGTALMATAILVSKDWGYQGGIELVSDSAAVEFYRRLGLHRKRSGATRNEFYLTPRAANRFLRSYEHAVREGHLPIDARLARG